VERVDINRVAQTAQTLNCAAPSGVPAYDITATNMDCGTAVRVVQQWTEMVANYKCPRYRCQVRELVCASGTEVFFSPRVSCSVGSRSVRWLTGSGLAQTAS